MIPSDLSSGGSWESDQISEPWLLELLETDPMKDGAWRLSQLIYINISLGREDKTPFLRFPLMVLIY